MKIPRTLLSAAFILSLAGSGLGLVLHGLTYFWIDPRSIVPITWYSFQLITAFAFIPALISLGRRDVHPNTTPTYEGFRWWLGLVGVILVVYAAFNFAFTDIVLLNGLEPGMRDGGYFVTSHGHYRSITQAEYIRYSAYWARASSGHWMVVCALIATELYDHLLGPRAEQDMTRAKGLA
jgi:hypothetical protein